MNSLDQFNQAWSEVSHSSEKWIETVASRSFEYGVLALKNMLFVSGGALVAIPAIAGLSDAFESSKAASAGLYFGIAVTLTVLCIYITHINWLSHFHVAIAMRERQRIEVWRSCFPDSAWPGLSQSAIDKICARHTRIINWTFVLPHVFGMIAFISFIYGAFLLYQSVGL